MSMISSLIDKLNKSEDEWNRSNMFELARMCREAADTIWELRDDLQRANAENAKLRELVEYMHRCFVRGHDWGPYCAGETVWVEQRMRELGIEVGRMTPTTNNVGPTTSATERLRRLLDERGVEWRGGLPTETMVEADGLDLLYVALPDGRVRAFIRNYLTPEQAIEATLGGADATGERQRDAVEVVRCKDCKYATDDGYGCELFSHYERGAYYQWEDVPAEVEPDGFCKWAVRREEDV